MGADKQLNRWAEHFEELLNRPAPQNQPDIQPAETDLPIDYNNPIREDIKKAIAHMKNGKVAGPDGIPAEALKADVNTSVEMLYSLFEGKRRNSSRMEGRLPYQDSQERRPEPL